MPTTAQADIAIIGLGVMGQNLALNMADHGFVVVGFDLRKDAAEQFIARHQPGSFGALGGSVLGCTDLTDLVRSLKSPRRILLMVPAGTPTDAAIDDLVPLLDKGDLIVDGGNAHWHDTIRREKALADKGILFVGSGVSGGEEGARFGPSLMPGGKTEAWALLEPVWTAIAAKVDAQTGRPIEGASPGAPVSGGESCAAFVGSDGAGHYVKMVHNGIEYADMQMICEAYHLMRTVGGLEPSELAGVFGRWNEGDLDSFLIEITADILRQTDPSTGAPLVDVVLDAAKQKGTGKWTSIAALDLAVPAATIAEAVFARGLSDLKEQRLAASAVLSGPNEEPGGAWKTHFDSRGSFVEAVGRALYCAKICSYAQGFALMQGGADEYGWTLDYGRIAMIWRGGCIIRAQFLQKITEAYAHDPKLTNLLLDPYFSDAIGQTQHEWRRVVSTGVLAGVPTPAFSSALAYYDGYRSAVLPANLLQAQRDYFGAHTYERTDHARGEFFHLDWLNPARPQLQT